MSDIDLDLFCYRGEGRDYLKRPFSFQDFTLATNGHIMVRVPLRSDAAEIVQKGKWLWPFDGIKGRTFARLSIRLPVSPAETGDCPECDGIGVSACDTDCARCAGTGDLDIEARTSTRLARHFFALNYVRLIARLPVAAIAPGSVSIAGRDVAPLQFRFAGGDGALMPMLSPHARHVSLATRRKRSEHTCG